MLYELRNINMPYEINRVGTYYSVVNKDTGRKYSEHTTKEKATAQLKLLESREDGSTKVPISRTVKYKRR